VATTLIRKDKRPRGSTNVAEAPFYIPATGSATRPRRILKYSDTFIVLDSHGDIGASGRRIRMAYFMHDTRFLSQLELLPEWEQPLLLGSNVRDDNMSLAVDLTNPDIYFDQSAQIVLLKDTLHIVRTLFLWRHVAYQRLRSATMATFRRRCSCPSSSTTISPTCSRCAACAARAAAPRHVSSKAPGRALLTYMGSTARRGNQADFDPPPNELSRRPASYRIALAPNESKTDFLKHRLRNP
jgi:hypothetical protein